MFSSTKNAVFTLGLVGDVQLKNGNTGFLDTVISTYRSSF